MNAAKSLFAQVMEFVPCTSFSPDLAAGLIRRARKLSANESLGVELHNTVYALDSSTIDLCLRLFDWAQFRSTKAAITGQYPYSLQAVPAPARPQQWHRRN